MGRILGVDVGSRRTGLALSDPSRLTCAPLAVIVEPDQVLLAQQLSRVAEEHRAELVVVGLPRPLRCEHNQQTESVLTLVERLRAMTDIPVVTWDERFTTSLAKRLPGRKAQLDAVAAAYMLQDYLDHLQGRHPDPAGEERA